MRYINRSDLLARMERGGYRDITKAGGRTIGTCRKTSATSQCFPNARVPNRVKGNELPRRTISTYVRIAI